MAVARDRVGHSGGAALSEDEGSARIELTLSRLEPLCCGACREYPVSDTLCAFHVARPQEEEAVALAKKNDVVPEPVSYIPALRYHVLTRFYDPVVRWTTREDAIKRRLVAGLGEAPGRVLDLGSGTGTLLSMVGSAYPTAKLVGLDADPAVIRLATKKLEGRAVFVHGDATAPPFETGSFDRVVSSLMLHHLTRSQKLHALVAARKLLVRGGELHVADWCRPDDAVMRTLFVLVQLLDGFETTRDNVRGELPVLIRKAGFRGVEETYRQRTVLGSMAIYRARF